MFCEECGNKLEDGAKFCTKCGAPTPVPQPVPVVEPTPAPTPVPQPAPQQAPAPKKPSLVPIIAVIIAIIVLIAAGVGIVASGALDGGFSFGNEVSDSDEDEDDEDEDEEATEDTETVVDTEEVETTEDEEATEVEIDPDPVVSIASVAATSNLPVYESKTYVAENVLDGDINTVWVEGVNGTGEGEYLEFTMDGTQKVSQIVIYNGYLQSYHLYNANGRVSKVLIEFDNGYSVEYELDYGAYGEDSDNPVSGYAPNIITLDEPIYTNSVRITVISAVAGDSYEDTCIAEIEFH